MKYELLVFRQWWTSAEAKAKGIRGTVRECWTVELVSTTGRHMTEEEALERKGFLTNALNAMAADNEEYHVQAFAVMEQRVEVKPA